jgi:hypothetical protein
VRDVPAHALMVGNPAHRLGWVCTCGDRLSGSLICSGCGEGHRLVSEQAGLAIGAVVRSIR